jgi:hypothetical protein
MNQYLIGGVCLLASLFACGHKLSQSSQGTSQEGAKPGQIPDSALSVGVVSENDIFLLSRLETTTQTPPIKIPAGEPLFIKESDTIFSDIQPLLKNYPAKQPYIIYSAEGSQTLTVSGVAITRAGCEEEWAVYPLFVTEEPLTKSEVVIARQGEASPAITSLRLFEPTNEVPESVRAILESTKTPPNAQKKIWARLLELDGDSGAELFVARFLYEPLGDQGFRSAMIEGFWFDEANGSWKIIEQNSHEVAQEDLLHFSSDNWVQQASPPLLVLDVENDKVAEVVRASATGYSLWRFDADKAKFISHWVSAADESCD